MSKVNVFTSTKQHTNFYAALLRQAIQMKCSSASSPIRCLVIQGSRIVQMPKIQVGDLGGCWKAVDNLHMLVTITLNRNRKLTI